MDLLKKLEQYEKRYQIAKVTVGRMPVTAMTGTLLMGGWLAAVTFICRAGWPWVAVLVTVVFVPLFLLIYYDVRKIGIRARARDRPREPRGAAGGSG